jgi:hypothetical protein
MEDRAISEARVTISIAEDDACSGQRAYYHESTYSAWLTMESRRSFHLAAFPAVSMGFSLFKERALFA